MKKVILSGFVICFMFLSFVVGHYVGFENGENSKLKVLSDIMMSSPCEVASISGKIIRIEDNILILEITSSDVRYVEVKDDTKIVGVQNYPFALIRDEDLDIEMNVLTFGDLKLEDYIEVEVTGYSKINREVTAIRITLIE